MSIDTMPVIRLELEQMKYSIISALQSRNDSFNQLIQDELDKLLDEGYLQSIIEQKVRAVIKEETSTKIEQYFSYGDGSKAIKEAVKTAFESR